MYCERFRLSGVEALNAERRSCLHGHLRRPEVLGDSKPSTLNHMPRLDCPSESAETFFDYQTLSPFQALSLKPSGSGRVLS